MECKVRPDRFDPASLAVFRRAYPQGRNLVVSPGVTEPYERRHGPLIVRVVGCQQLLLDAET